MVANGVANMEQAFYKEDHYEDFTIKLLCVMFEMLPVFLKSGRLRAFGGKCIGGLVCLGRDMSR